MNKAIKLIFGTSEDSNKVARLKVFYISLTLFLGFMAVFLVWFPAIVFSKEASFFALIPVVLLYILLLLGRKHIKETRKKESS